MGGGGAVVGVTGTLVWVDFGGDFVVSLGDKKVFSVCFFFPGLASLFFWGLEDLRDKKSSLSESEEITGGERKQKNRRGKRARDEPLHTSSRHAANILLYNLNQSNKSQRMHAVQ